MTKHVSNLKPVKLVEPTLGCVLLAQSDAEEIGRLLNTAVYHGTKSPVIESLYQERVSDAQKRLRTMARRLGFDLVPTRVRETVDAR